MALSRTDRERVTLAAEVLDASGNRALARAQSAASSLEIVDDLRWADRCYLAAETLRDLIRREGED
jgi:hypothetical protein